MMLSPLHLQFIDHLTEHHSSLKKEELVPLISANLISPFTVKLPKDILQQAQDFVRSAYALRQSKSYQAGLQPEIQSYGLKDPGNKSILMSYDFHVSGDDIKLIEVNTNASFLALGFEMYRMRKIPLPILDFKMDEIRQNIENEIRLQGKSLSERSKIAIIDEEPEKQRLYAEFLVYQAYFRTWGFDCEIYDYRKIPSDRDFIYNRFTDFYLKGPESQNLKKDFISEKICLSPNPYEYLLLADKQRMIDWQALDIPKRNLPLALSLTHENAEQIWTERKKFFFKPKRAFGAKQSYKGASISRKAFEEIIPHDFLAQEYFGAPEFSFQGPAGELSFKYDLRFYAYQDRVQLALARLYNGQVTNLKTADGGFAPIIFE